MWSRSALEAQIKFWSFLYDRIMECLKSQNNLEEKKATEGCCWCLFCFVFKDRSNTMNGFILGSLV